MVEPLMYFALGALAAGLFALAILPLVHARAVRLAARRIEANLPLSLKQIRADKDLLRAEFAVAAWRYERTIEQLKATLAGQRAELGRKINEVNRLKLKLGKDTMRAPEAQRGAPTGVTIKPERAAERPPIRLADLAKLNPDIEQSPLVPGFDHVGEPDSPPGLEPAGPPDVRRRE